MSLRKFEITDLDLCIDMCLDFVNALEHGEDDPWTENAVAERLKGILESPVFAGFVLEEDSAVKGFVLGVYSYGREGACFEVQELFTASGLDAQATAAAMLRECLPLLRSAKVLQLKAFSSGFWDAGFFSAQGFGENPGVKLFERAL